MIFISFGTNRDETMNSLLLINKGGKSSAEVAYINENYILKKKIGLFTGMEFHLNIISKDYKTKLFKLTQIILNGTGVCVREN